MSESLEKAKKHFREAASHSLFPHYQNKVMARGLFDVADYLDQLDHRLHALEKKLDQLDLPGDSEESD